ncbi:MAG: GNAT family N-acetyltransferase, partial [Kangiellaceae bacterium]|nr:GNAT family N-acetyltransferase [Kangiellaceae bacterium]
IGAEQWNELVSRSTRPSIYATYDYIKLSVKYFNCEAVEKFLIVIEDNLEQKLVAIFPMSLWHRQCYKKTVRVMEHLITTHTSDVDKPYPIIDAGSESIAWRLFAKYIKTELSNWDWLEYDELISESLLQKLSRKLFPFPQYIHRHSDGPLSSIIDLSESWAEFSKPHKNMRKKIKRIQNKLGENFRYKVYHSLQDMERCLQEYVAVESAGWKAYTGVSDAEAIEFYSELLPRFATNKQILVGTLYDGDRPISVELSYIYNGTVYFAHGTYHPDYAKLSPGTVSTSLSIQYLCEKYREGDFLAGFADYTHHFASHIYPTQKIAIFKINGIFFYYLILSRSYKVKSKLKNLAKKMIRLKKEKNHAN